MDALRVFASWDGRPAVLATIVETRGHSYRKPGACMLLGRDGWRSGSISPGCLESDLSLRAELLMDKDGAEEARRWERVLYEMESPDDLMWGEAIGCGGSVTVLLEVVAGELAACLRDALSLAGPRDLYLERSILGENLTCALKGEDDLTSPDSEAGRWSSRLRIPGRPRLILFGAGADSAPTARLAAEAGFRVVVADWREELCTEAAFPGVELACGQPGELAARLGMSPDDYVLICSHQLQKDRAMLEQAASRRVRYIGVLGSRKRVAMLTEGLSLSQPVHGPVGLDIGADGAEEIAVSIVAELIAMRRRSSIQGIMDGRERQRRRPQQAFTRERGASRLHSAGDDAGSSCPVQPGRTL